VPELTFGVRDAKAVPYSATPQIAFEVVITNSTRDEPIHALLLRCQVRIDAASRAYSKNEEQRLRDVFGERADWQRSMRSLLWAQVSASVPPFSDETAVELFVPYGFDFDVASSKYLLALEGGEVPVTLLFSGTAFHRSKDAELGVSHIPLTAQASFALPLAVREAVRSMHYPNKLPLELSREHFERLCRYRTELGLPTWEHVIEHLLAGAELAGRAERSARGEPLQ
jgi:hypothetical protein